MVIVKGFEGNDGLNPLLWTREVKMAMHSVILRTEPQRVVLAIAKSGGSAREWALTCGAAVDTAFPTWELLKRQLVKALFHPNHAYQLCFRFLARDQGKMSWWTLSNSYALSSLAFLPIHYLK